MEAISITIRSATEADFSAINAIYNYFVPRSTCTYQYEEETLAGRMTWFQHHGGDFPVIVAVIDGEQAGSLALHARYGFTEVGRLREVGFKFGRWLDAVYMERMVAEETAATTRRPPIEGTRATKAQRMMT